MSAIVISTPYALVVIACSKSKRLYAAPAEDLYTGQVFRQARSLAKALAPVHGWRILSAKHGILHPRTPVAPYDQVFGAPGSITPDEVLAQGKARCLTRLSPVLFLGSRRYADAARSAWPHLDAPAENLSIGRMRHVYSQMMMEAVRKL